MIDFRGFRGLQRFFSGTGNGTEQSPFSANINISSPLSAFGDLRTVELTPVFSGIFEYTVDNTQLNKNTVVGSGTITQANAMAVISTGTTTGSTACLTSRQHARYHSGLGSLTRFTTLFETPPAAGTTMVIGLFDEPGSSTTFKNGLGVGYDGSTFGFFRFANDVKFFVPQTAWDDPLDGTGSSGHNLTQATIQNLTVWYTNFEYLGGGGLQLTLELPDKSKVVVHTIKYSGLFTQPSSFNPNYFFTIFASNGATTTDMVVKIGSYSYFIEGKSDFTNLHRPQFSTDEQTKSGITAQIPIVTVRNKALYAGKTNFIECILEQIIGSVEASSANNLATLRIVKNGSLTGAAFVDNNTTDSTVEVDTTATAITGGKVILPFPLAGKNDKLLDNLLPFQHILRPGDSMTITGQSTNSATMKASMLWEELF